MRFLDLGIEDAVPGAKTLWLYREALAKADAVEELFGLFDAYLKDKGYLARASAGSKRFSPEGKKEKREGREGGQIIDATIVSAPKQRNSGEENETIKEGKTPEEWEKNGQELPEGQGRALDEEA